MKIKIDSSELYKYKAKLGHLGKNAFPLTVRGTLNEAAIDMKKETIRESFYDNFTIRRKTFIKAFSAAERCSNTLDIHKMESKAGAYRGKKNQKFGEDLQKQEFGGAVTNRAIPFKGNVRVGGSDNKIIKKTLQYAKLRSKGLKKGHIVSTDARGGAIFQTKKGAIIYLPSGAKYEYFENGNTRFIANNKTKVLYTKKRNGNIDKKPFIKPAAIATSRKLPRFFKKEYEYRLSKIKKK